MSSLGLMDELDIREARRRYLSTFCWAALLAVRHCVETVFHDLTKQLTRDRPALPLSADEENC